MGGTACGSQRTPAEEPTRADVETAEKHYSSLEYDQASRTAVLVLKQKGLAREQMIRTYRVLALSLAALDRGDESRSAFVTLLAMDPDFQVDSNLGPRFTSPFFEARGYWRGQAVKPGVEAQSAPKPGESAAVRVTLHDPTHIARKVTVMARWAPPANEYASYNVPPAAETSQNVSVGTPPKGASRLEYYVSVTDSNENIVMEAGNVSSPRSAQLPTEAAPTPSGAVIGGGENRKSGGGIFSSPAFWVVLGGLALGGAGAGIFFATRPADGATSARLQGGISCGGVPCN